MNLYFGDMVSLVLQIFSGTTNAKQLVMHGIYLNSLFVQTNKNQKHKTVDILHEMEMVSLP